MDGGPVHDEDVDESRAAAAAKDIRAADRSRNDEGEQRQGRR